MLVVLQGRDGAEPRVGQVGHAGRPVVGVHRGLPAAQRPPERFPELCRQGVVKYGIYGAEKIQVSQVSSMEDIKDRGLDSGQSSPQVLSLKRELYGLYNLLM